MMDYEYLQPNWLWLLLLLPFLYFLLHKLEKKKEFDVFLSNNDKDQEVISSNWISSLRLVYRLIFVFIFALFIFALAKPFNWKTKTATKEDFENGIDIILALDVSLSMYAKDFEPNRLEASKIVAKEFIDSRKTDRIGLVVYAGEAFTACPSTLDHDVLKSQLDRVDGEHIDGGTAIGTGLGTAVARLRNDSIPSKVVILLTDGSNNSGTITPDIATELAVSKNVRVYTIGVGTNGEALSPVPTPFGIRYENVPVVIDEETLKNIALKTGGKYFRATDNKALRSIYKEIEQLEKSKIKSNDYKIAKPSNPEPFLKWAFLLLLVTLTSRVIIFRNDE
mgnify:CR=1 FL=1|jgi:Ca-activated chloride channel family protein